MLIKSTSVRSRIIYVMGALFLFSSIENVLIYFYSKNEGSRKQHEFELTRVFDQLKNKEQKLNEDYAISNDRHIHYILEQIKLDYKLPFIGYFFEDRPILQLEEEEKCKVPEVYHFNNPLKLDKTARIEFCLNNYAQVGIPIEIKLNLLFDIAIMFIFVLILNFLFKRDFDAIREILKATKSTENLSEVRLRKDTSLEVKLVCEELLNMRKNEISIGESVHDLRAGVNRLRIMRSISGEIKDDDMKDLIHISSEVLEKIKGDFEPKLSDTSVTQSIQMVLRESKTLAKSRDISFIVPELPDVVSKLNDTKFRLVLRHMIDNSLRSIETPSGKISISMEMKARNAIIRVTDTGKGIPQEKQKSLWTPGNTTKPDGNGFGLSAAQKYIEECGGKLELISTSEHGTIFEITLVSVPKTDHVLIDDADINQTFWLKKAKEHGKSIRVFSSITDFENDWRSIPFSTPITIDSRLGDGIRGEDESLKIYNLGFKTLFIASNGKVDLAGKYWLKEGTKNLPWEELDSQKLK